MAKNTDRRFACPDGHLDTETIGSLTDDLYEVEKYFCRSCGKFFYLHTMNGSREFADELSTSVQISYDERLPPAKGFEHGADKIIRKKRPHLVVVQ